MGYCQDGTSNEDPTRKGDKGRGKAEERRTSIREHPPLPPLRPVLVEIIELPVGKEGEENEAEDAEKLS